MSTQVSAFLVVRNSNNVIMISQSNKTLASLLDTRQSFPLRVRRKSVGR
jgi:hypothetical protein